MNYWDTILDFHKKQSEATKIGIEGYKAFKFIHKMALQLNFDFPSSPYMNVRFISNSHYPWLIRFAKILALISQIPNYETHVKRFFSNNFETSLSAIYEIEIALRLHIEGIDIKFPEESQNSKSPDVVMNLDDGKYNIEVTSINYPQSVQWMNELYTKIISLGFRNRVKLSGNLMEPHSKKQIKLFLAKLQDAIQNYKTSNSVKRISEDGLGTVQIGTNTSTTFQSSGFTFRHTKPIDMVDKIIRIMEKKQDQLKVNNNPGIICVFNGTEVTDPMHLFNADFDEINIALSTYSRLLGVVVSNYKVFYARELKQTQIKKKGNRMLIELSPALEPRETSLIWKDEVSDLNLPIEFINAFENYQINLNKLDNTVLPSIDR
ncbi:MAG: hypothetical protein ACTSPI_09155 [Candidatus Heimdallarchaeaceae archaeon]